MPFDPREVETALALPDGWGDGMHRRWLRLMELAVWGDLKTRQIGLLPKLRKRCLELGERCRSVLNDPAWIPHPRERIKHALGSSLGLEDALAKLEESARLLDGGNDLDAFRAELEACRAERDSVLGPRDGRLATLLDSQYGEEV